MLSYLNRSKEGLINGLQQDCDFFKTHNCKIVSESNAGISSNSSYCRLPVLMLFAVVLILVSVQVFGVPKDSLTVLSPVAKNSAGMHENRVLQVRGDNNYAPFEYLNKDGKPDGFNVDVFRAVAKVMGIKIQIDLGLWNEMVTQLDQGKIDALLGMFVTDDREKKFDFSTPYFVASSAVYVRKDSKIRSILDVKDKRIIQQLGTHENEYVKNNGITSHVILKNDGADVLNSLSDGEGDCAILSRLNASILIRRFSITNIKAVGSPIIQRNYAVAVLDGNSQLLSEINEGLSIIKESGEYRRIYEKWFGIYEEHPFSFLSILKYFIWIFIPILVIGLVGWFWIWSLRKQVEVRTIALNNELIERKRVEAELVVAKEHAETSDRLKSAFLANMSHEIRTPMNGILGFTELLKESGLSEKQQQGYIQIIEKSGIRLLGIINDIVDISKIEAGLMKVFVKETNINEKIEHIYSFFKPEVEAKGIQLLYKNSLSSNESIIKTDEDKFFSILTNLVKNAIKYTNEGSIEFGYNLKTDRKPFELEFFVKDTGIGIRKDKQKAIFERFIQADISDKMARQGAGLGLSISKAFVELLGGDIWLESEEGKGSAFYFTIPYDKDSYYQIDTKNVDSVMEKEMQFRNLNVLIVEDDETSRLLISTIINKISHHIIHAETGMEAIEVCRNSPELDLVLMDVKMPGMNGYEATRQIRQFNKDVIIIAQTAYGFFRDREKALEAGCNNYVCKPINKDELMELIHGYFDEQENLF